MHLKLKRLLGQSRSQASDGIYTAELPDSMDQADEVRLREKVATSKYDDYLKAISGSHSIPVMDYEVDRFLSKIPEGGVILDVGGCWGWHWRRLASTRPDVGVLIIDFVRANLFHAKHILGKLVGEQVALMHADATALPFSDASEDVGFDGIWTVQVFQHIPDFRRACNEAHRVCRPGGVFINYSLHNTPTVRVVYRLLGKAFTSEGMIANTFYLCRANEAQKKVVSEIFGNVTDRYTECFFSPRPETFLVGLRI